MTESSTSVSDLARLLKVIADETRLRILGAIAARPLTGKDLATLLDLTPATISHHMRKLTEAGIVLAESEAQRQWYRLNADLLLASRKVAIAPAPAPPTEPGDDVGEAFRQKVLRNFFDGERLKEIPAQRKRRVIVLQHLLERFMPGTEYTEREVNDLLRPAHPDVATLRRELVDYGYLERQSGIYHLARGTPERSAQVAQEVPGDESAWLRALIDKATHADHAITS